MTWMSLSRTLNPFFMMSFYRKRRVAVNAAPVQAEW